MLGFTVAISKRDWVARQWMRVKQQASRDPARTAEEKAEREFQRELHDVMRDPGNTRAVTAYRPGKTEGDALYG